MLKYFVNLLLFATINAGPRVGFGNRGFGNFRGRFGGFGGLGGLGNFGSPFGFGGFRPPIGGFGGVGGFGTPFGFGGLSPFARSGFLSNDTNDGLSETKNLKLCTFRTIDQEKCLQTLLAAEVSSITLSLECEQLDNRDLCIQSVKNGSSDIVILDGNDYQSARNNGLKPVLYVRTREESRYIAVIPKELKLTDLNTTPILVDETNDRAFRAAILFNWFRGHDICPDPVPSSGGIYINIIDSNDFIENNDEILICPNKALSGFSDYRSCNFEASLQTAIFARNNINISDIGRIYETFETILSCFGNPPNNNSNFIFFAPTNGTANVLLSDKTKAFDIFPNYENYVNEEVFSMLHCDSESNEYSSAQLQ